MTKYRLKKDTPEFKAGTVFDMIENIDVGKVLTMNAPREDAYAFEVDSIDNFDEWFEEVKQPSWEKPDLNHLYFYVDDTGPISNRFWLGCSVEEMRWSLGNCFKTEKAAERYREYLRAIATVRQDEGVLIPDDVRKTLARDGTVYTVGINCTMLSVEHLYNTSAGAIYFDTGYNAKTSCDKHQDEWRTIADYDWSRE